jgi:hypothetical protein
LSGKACKEILALFISVLSVFSVVPRVHRK